MIRGIRAWWPSPWEVQRREDLELKASLGYLVWSSQEERYLNETPITSANVDISVSCPKFVVVAPYTISGINLFTI